MGECWEGEIVAWKSIKVPAARVEEEVGSCCWEGDGGGGA